MTTTRTLLSGLAAAVLAILAAPCPAAEVVLAVGRSLPPYVIAEEWRGIEYDIVKRSLESEGHTISPRVVPLARVARDLELGKVDAATPMIEASGVKAFYSQSHITYRNVAISLASRDLHIDKVADLAGKSVIAFQNATKFLGPDYAAAVAANPQYREEDRQVVQPVLLFLGRTDVVVADRNIFAWFADSPEVKAKADTTQAVRFHPLFPPTEYHVAFRDEAIRDAFDRGLKRLKDSGEYARIVQSYSRFLHEEKPGQRAGLSR
ncbi:MAG: substrate-binding periplasmic protein [Actinomycetota bacterium]